MPNNATTHRRLSAILPALILLFLLCACGTPADRVRIKGKFEHVSQIDLYIYSVDGLIPKLDTIKLRDGKFNYECALGQTAILNLVLPNFSQMQIIAEPGKTIEVKGDAAKLSETRIRGTEENELLTDFRLQQLGKPEGNVRLAAAQFIRDHAKQTAALAAFRKYFAEEENLDAETALPLLKALVKAQPQNPMVALTAQKLEPILKTSKGQPLPDFEVSTIDGKHLTQNDFKGKPLVVVFYATWNGECSPMFRAVRRMERSGKRPNFLIVSLDADLRMLRGRLEHDTLQSPAVCDRLMFDSPIAKTFGVRYLPGNLFVNSKGRIVARDVTDIKQFIKQCEDLN